jgi:hypothetical protein
MQRVVGKSFGILCTQDVRVSTGGRWDLLDTDWRCGGLRVKHLSWHMLVTCRVAIWWSVLQTHWWSCMNLSYSMGILWTDERANSRLGEKDIVYLVLVPI